MLGLILCGGQSRRMGSDKGMLMLQGKNWAKTAADKMAALNIPIKLSVNEQQQSFYSSHFLKEDLIVDAGHLLIKGPLLGLLSCHFYFPDEDIFVLACDMPLMKVFILQSLLEVSQTQKADAFVFTNEGDAEPLCGIYKAKGLATVAKMLQNEPLQKNSMKYVLGLLLVNKTPIKEEDKKFFCNANTQNELKGL